MARSSPPGRRPSWRRAGEPVKHPVAQEPLARLLRLGHVVRGRLVLAAAAGAAATGCAVALLAVSGFLLARASQHPSIIAITAAVVAVRAFSVGRGVFRYTERLTSHDAAFRVLADTRVAVYRRLARLAPTGLSAFRSGDLLARLTSDVDATQDLFIRGIAPPLAAALVGAGAVTACLLILAPAAGVLAAGLLAGGLAVPAVAAAADRASRRRASPARGDLAAGTVNLLDGAADLHAFGAGDAALDRVAARDAELTALARRSAAAAGLGTGLTSLASGLTVWGVLILGVAATGSGTLGRVPLAVVTLTALAAFEAVSPLTGAALQIGHSRSAACRVFAVLDVPDPVREPPRPLPPPEPPVTVALRAAQVRYRPDAPFALDGLDLDLGPGRRVALVGPNGAGKSTVAALLMRFVDLAGGTATLCGHDLAGYAADDVRRVIGGCPQDPHVFDTTIADNLRLARPGASDEELADAAARARLLPWIESLPSGFQTPVGVHGTAISGGERQRLALARALLADPAVLILDEPAASLDPDARRALTADLLDVTAGRATLLITHEPDGLDRVDEIVVLEAGRVVQRGTHRELLGAAGLYRWMWDRRDLRRRPGPPLPGPPERPLRAQGDRADDDQQADVEQQLLQRAEGLRPAPVHDRHADVRGGRDRRDRDEHAGERGRLGQRQGHHADQAGDDGDDDGEQVGGVDQVRDRPDAVQVLLGRMAGPPDAGREGQRAGDRERETGQQHQQPPVDRPLVSVVQPERHRDDRAVFRAHHHRPHDEDLRVGQDAAGADQPGEHQQGEEAGRILRVRPDLRLHQVPHRRMLPVIRPGVRLLVRAVGDSGVHGLDQHRAVPVQAEIPELPQHPVGGGLLEVELHRVPVRPLRGRRQHHQVGHTRVRGEPGYQPPGDLDRAHHPNVQHGIRVSQPAAPGITRPG